MGLELIKGDITKMNTDAIVNAANNFLKMGGGVCGAIFRAAGIDALSKECDMIGYLETGEACITNGYNLAAKYVIHTVGPVYRGGNAGEQALLKKCYQNALSLAKEKGLSSVAFPLISAGIFGYPQDEALKVAFNAINEFLLHEDMNVYLAVIDDALFKRAQSLRS
jgi:O-acetyl-ADP-ribose deacetylase (regulator of RNase III)